jgi:type II secretory pathway component PulC
LTAFLKQINKYFEILLRKNVELLFKVFQSCLSTFSRHTLQINPKKINHLITGGLILFSIGISIYWLMNTLQIPNPPTITVGEKSTALVSNQNIGPANSLFGEKPLAVQNIFLRGIVITSKNSSDAFDGFAIFEINGKPTNVIAIGEGLGSGLTLKSIKPESATLLYQGKEIEFILSKSKATSPSKNKNP